MNYTGKSFTDSTRGELTVVGRAGNNQRSYVCRDAGGAEHVLSSKYLGQYFDAPRRAQNSAQNSQSKEPSLYDVKELAQKYIESLDMLAQCAAARDIAHWLDTTFC